ncbi:hypothetical protein IMZ48_22970 [Candidatus Bathyarchaeota archaeon]|nr:hypothetical protein [Candidatus Bathyarchaeota archaeon]
MKLYAQHGFGDGLKTAEGLRHNFIDGVIFSPRDIGLDRLRAAIGEAREAKRDADILFDPQFYATFAAVDPQANIGKLAEDYPYFQARRRSQLLSERRLRDDLGGALKLQIGLDVTAVIAPNVIIPRSFDSTESAIAMDFISNTRIQFSEMNDRRPIYATLAVGRDALLDKEELVRFLTDLTTLEDRPDGFYVLIAVNSADARTEVCHADMISGWLLLNYVLTVNGYHVVNGYSDVLSPFLGAVGGKAGATGWWSNLRNFSLDRFAAPLGGGRQPVERYLSCGLLNRITYFELEAIRRLHPRVLNGISTDEFYPEGSSQPNRAQEVLQSWEAIKRLNENLVSNDIISSLRQCLDSLAAAQGLYIDISVGMEFDAKSNAQHLEPLQEGIRLFARLAELELP